MWPCGASRPQFALIRRACEAYGLEMIEGAGYEADDVIASLALEVRLDTIRKRGTSIFWLTVDIEFGVADYDHAFVRCREKKLDTHETRTGLAY